MYHLFEAFLEVILIFLGSKLKLQKGLVSSKRSSFWAWLISCGDEGPSDADYRKDIKRFLPQKSKGKKHFWYIFVDAKEDEIIAGAEEAVLCGEESKILAAFSWTIPNQQRI